MKTKLNRASLFFLDNMEIYVQGDVEARIDDSYEGMMPEVESIAVYLCKENGEQLEITSFLSKEEIEKIKRDTVEEFIEEQSRCD